jgi:sulfide:quinone oxidoreductase
MSGKTVVILGAGTGGLVTAHRLRRALNKEHRIVLVDRSPRYSFAPAFTGVMLGRRTPDRISRDLRKLEKRGIEVVIGEVTSIQPDRKTVEVETKELTYDYLVIALGVQFSSEEVPGLNKAYTYYHSDGAEGLRDKLSEFEGGRVAVVVSGMPYTCPAAPYEAALLLEDHFRKKKMRDRVELHVYTPESAPLPVAGPEIGERAQALLASRDIGFSGGVTPKSVNQTTGHVNFEDGSEAPFDLLVATPVHRVPDVLVASGFAVEGGWVPVERETLITNFEDVYCIGDSARIVLECGLPLPKAGVFAHGEAEVVCRNISAEITGGQPIWAFGGQGACFLETGGGKAAYISGDFYAEPTPDVAMRGPNRLWGLAKTGFERVWLWRWF